jgi:NADH dehydrogenase
LKKIVVIGGGFGGVYAAKELCNLFGGKARILLVNRTNYFLFTPLLHEVATGSLSRRSIILPIREMVNDEGFELVKGDAKRIDLKSRKVFVDCGNFDRMLEYDYLILALGSTTEFFNIPGAEKNTFTLKSLEDAHRLRNHVIDMFESAQSASREERKDMLRFVVVGGGPTGIETAAELSDLIKKGMRHIYSGTKDAEIVVVHSSKRLLSGFSDRMDRFALERLKKLGIKVLLESRAERVTREGVKIAGRGFIRSKTVIWTAGVRPNSIQTYPALKTFKGRIVVDRTLQVVGMSGVFAVGDNSLIEGSPCPATAQAAIQQSRAAARNIFLLSEGKKPEVFRYKHGGNLMSIGPRYAVADIGGVLMNGMWVWLLWRTVYLSKMMGARNKAKIAFDWFLELVFNRDTSQV